MEKKFKVGDIVRGTEAGRSEYSITNDEMARAEVIEIGDHDIRVKILEHKYKINIGDKYWVNSKYFELVKSKANSDTQKLEITTNGTTTKIKFEDGREGIAKLYYKDKYNKGFGIVTALGKAMGIDLVSEVASIAGGYTLNGVDIDTDKSSSKFEIGCKVKIPKTKLGDKNVEDLSNCIRNAIKIKQDHLFLIRLDKGDSKDIYVLGLKKDSISGDWFYLEDLELYEEIPKFKVGDIVRGTKAGNGRFEENKITVAKVKVGDKVKMISEHPEHSFGHVKTGDIGVVIGLQEDGSIKVDFPNQSYWTAEADELELVIESKTTFKVGDKVRVKVELVDGKTYDGLHSFVGEMNDFVGKETVIKSIISDGSFILEGFNTWCWTQSMLEKVEEEFKVGDYIYFTNKNGKYNICKISKIDGNELWGNWTGDNIIELPKTIKEFESLNKHPYETFMSKEDSSLKKLVLIDDTKSYIEVNKNLWKEFLTHDVAIYCKTEKEANELLDYCDTLGIKWMSGNSLKHNNHFGDFEKQVYYCGDSKMTYGSVDCASKVVTLTELFTPENEIKSLFKVGQIINGKEAEQLIKAGGRAKKIRSGFEYYLKDGELYYTNTFGDTDKSGGYRANITEDDEFKIINLDNKTYSNN